METQDPTKVRLLEAAGEEFAAKGYDAARIRTICERAEANLAAVNYHFGDKEQLYVQAVLDAHRCGCRSVRRSIRRCRRPPSSGALSITSWLMSWPSTILTNGGTGCSCERCFIRPWPRMC